MEPTRLATFITSYSAWLSSDPNYYNVLKPVLKDGSLVGVALNGLTGGTITSATPSGNVTIPSSEVNNVYNYYNIWINGDGFIAPDYINITGNSSSFFVSRIRATYTDSIKTQITNCLNAFTNGFSWNEGSISYSSDNDIVGGSTSGSNYFIGQPDNSIITGLTNNLCVSLGLSANNDTINYSQLITKDFSSFTVSCYDKETLNQLKFKYSNGTSIADTSNYSINVKAGSSVAQSYPIFIGNFTLYRNAQVVNSIKNNNYNAPQYTTNNYNNYNPQNDNTYEVPSNQISNSITDNSSVYENVNTSNNTNITTQIDNSDNSYSYIDNSQVITNTTNIVNTYYEYNYGTGGNGGGSGGDNDSGNGSGGLEDDSILDALLAAILKLLRAIGKIIATILTGIIDIITDVLEAITNITTSFTGIIEFIGSIFGFLPSECVAVLTLGLTISVLIALIKMFGK